MKVASDDSIEYDGRIYKLSPFVGTFLPEEKRTPSNAYQGSKYFSYNGKILDDLRTAFEKEADNEINIVETVSYTHLDVYKRQTILPHAALISK